MYMVPRLNIYSLTIQCLLFFTVLCNIYTFQQDTQCSCTDCLLTLQRGVTSTARHSENITCRGLTSTARHAARSPSFVYISTT